MKERSCTPSLSTRAAKLHRNARAALRPGSRDARRMGKDRAWRKDLVFLEQVAAGDALLPALLLLAGGADE
eukprot:1558159-Rhodomonas_salina.1